MANGNRKIRTITGGYTPDRRSQGQKHGELAKKKKVQKETQQRHVSLLTNDGKGTPRKKVKTAGVGKLAGRTQGPKPNPLKADTSGTKNLGVKKPKVKAASAIKKRQGVGGELKTSGALKSPKKMSYQDQLASRRKKRKLSKAKGVMDKADAAARSGKLRKAARLERRSIRKAERAAGKRKSAVGTALKGAGLGLARGLARVGGYGGKFKKGLASKKNK